MTILGATAISRYPARMTLTLDFDYLQQLRRGHPAWTMLRAEHAPMVIGFLQRAFIAPNVRSVAEQPLVAQLDDWLYHLRQHLDDDPFPREARAYLNEWADDRHRWLRKYYPAEGDEPHFDLTPAAEQALHWLSGLEQRQFIGAESRLKQVFDLLREIDQGNETDPEARIRELERRRVALDAEIAEIRAGRLTLMDATALRERFQQMSDTARALLADFRQVEQNFRDLDREVRERIATWEGGKGELLEEIFGDHDAIRDSDQGRSFHAFWDFLMSPARQEELTDLLERTLTLKPVAELAPDPRLARIHYDWLIAGEVAQRTVARLSEQLRRYLDDQGWLENRRIMAILRDVERHALALRDDPPSEEPMVIDEPAPRLELPMERSLFTPPLKPRIDAERLASGDEAIEAAALFDQHHVDKERLRARVRRALQTRDQIGLAELLDEEPLRQGLAELVAWLAIATEDGQGLLDDDHPQQLAWQDDHGRWRRARLPRVIFTRQGATTA